MDPAETHAHAHPHPHPARPSLSVVREPAHSAQPHAPARVPTLTHHTARTLGLPTPDFLNPIASGAHYAGALSPPAHEPPHKGAKRRTLSMSGDDPVMLAAYHDVLKDLEELFCARTTPELIERRWRHDAEYEDPLCKCRGITECAAQFFALAKICSSSIRLSCRVVSATLKPNKLVLAQTQEYTLRWIGVKKTISSFILVDLDDEFKIIKLVDQWNGDKLPTRWGALPLRRLAAKFTSWIMPMPQVRSS